ncbi:hypothetical protein [Crossiella sp. CA198]|uniref:hypothetical protein n=1 Tax=Crossiella sp. CA198 TaxID=3455607 RepID=UPI003F8D13C0
MSQHQPPPLPPYRAVLVADSRDHGGQGPPRPPDEAVPEVLCATFARIGHPGLWQELTFQDSTADGHTLALDTQHLPLLIDPYLQGLHQELAFRHRSAHGPALRHPLRLRISLSVGPLAESPQATARGEAHNLVSAQSVRNLLCRTEPGVGFVAAILSDRVFTDVVRAGYTRLTPAEFTRTEVRVKQYHGTAYLHLPQHRP